MVIGDLPIFIVQIEEKFGVELGVLKYYFSKFFSLSKFPFL